MVCAASGALCAPSGGVGGGEQRSGVVKQLASSRRQGDRALVSDEELGAELALQRADLATERGLGDVQLLGRLPEVQGVGDRDEVADLAEINVHGRHPS